MNSPISRRSFLGATVALPAIGSMAMASEPIPQTQGLVDWTSPLLDMPADGVKAHLVIVTRNDPQWLKLCLDSIRTVTKGANYSIMVSDNGSSIKNFNMIEKIALDRGAGFTSENRSGESNWSRAANVGAWNQGIGSPLVFMHPRWVPLNDQWLVNLLSPLSPINQVHISGLLMEDIGIKENWYKFISHHLMAMTVECFHATGGFDPVISQRCAGLAPTKNANNVGMTAVHVKNNGYVHEYDMHHKDDDDPSRTREQICQFFRSLDPMKS